MLKDVQIVNSDGQRAMLPAAFEAVPSDSTSDTAAHAWFNRMVALSTCVGSVSMRNQAEIDAHTPAPPNELYRYIYPNDPHPEAIDACKYTLPALQADGTVQASQPTNKKVELTFGKAKTAAAITRGILIVSWEMLFTQDWKIAFTPLPGEDWKAYKFKTWQLTHPQDKIYFESRNLWGRARGPQYVSIADLRNYDVNDYDPEAWMRLGINNPTGYWPTGERAIPNLGTETGGVGGFDVPVSKLLRYYKEIQIGVDAGEFDKSWNRWRPTAPPMPVKQPDGSTQLIPWIGPVPPGRYNMISEYVVGEDFDPVCLLDRAPATFKHYADGTPCEIGKFYSEMNTSSHNQRHGDAIAYMRNMVAWLAERGLADDPSPLSRPIR